MRSTLLSIGLLLVFSTSLRSQDQSVLDTLDWRRYFPLEIGNEWQYRRINEPFERDQFITWKIEGDTLIDQVPYFLFHRIFYDSDLSTPSDHISSIRYDSASASVVQHLRFPDGRPIEDPLGYIPCGLNADFNSLNTCSFDNQFVYGVFGNYGANVTILDDMFMAPSFKEFDSLVGGSIMVSDVGMVQHIPEGPFSSVQRLEYVRVGKLVYGSPPVTVSNETSHLQKEISPKFVPFKRR